MMVVQDFNAGGNVLSHANTGQLLNSIDIDSPPNPTYSTKFKILWDKTFAPNSQLAIKDGTQYIYSAKTMSFDIVLKNTIPISYQGPTGGLSELVSNSLYIFLISEVDDVDERVIPTIYYQAMIYYEDN